MKNGDMPAMPAVEKKKFQAGYHTIMTDVYHQGLTKREAFAKAAMQGLCTISGYGDIADIAHDAVRYADALLDELERTKSS